MALFSLIAVSILGCVSPVFGTYGYGYGYGGYHNVHVVQPILPAIYKSPLVGYQYSHIRHTSYPFVSQPYYGGLLGVPCFTSPFTSTTWTKWPKTIVAPKVDIKAKNGTKHIFKEVYPPGFLTPIFSYQGSIQNIRPKEGEGQAAEGAAPGAGAPGPMEGGVAGAGAPDAAEAPAPAGPAPPKKGGAEGPEKRETEREDEADASKKSEKARAAKMLKKKSKRSDTKKSQKLSRMPNLSI